jgi:HEAT repeat protein
MTSLKLITFAISIACVHSQTLDERAWTILSEGTTDKSYEKRSKAIHSLGMLSNNARARTLAETGLTDGQEEVRATSADVLGIMHATESVPKLKAAVMDKATSVVFAAANALYVIGDPSAYQVYYAVLTGQKKERRCSG